MAISRLGTSFVGTSDVTGCSFLFLGEGQRASSKRIRASCTREVGQVLGLFCNFLPRGKALYGVSVARQGSHGFMGVRVPGLAIQRGRFHSSVRMRRSSAARR